MYGKAGRIGLAVLDIDLCIEPDLRRVLPEGVEIHNTRVMYPHEVTVEAMAQARRGLDLAVRSLAAVQPRAIVWSCTSGSFYNGVVGNEDLLAQLARASAGIPVATASSALVASLRALHIKRPAVCAKYQAYQATKGRLVSGQRRYYGIAASKSKNRRLHHSVTTSSPA